MSTMVCIVLIFNNQIIFPLTVTESAVTQRGRASSVRRKGGRFAERCRRPEAPERSTVRVQNQSSTRPLKCRDKECRIRNELEVSERGN